jgi:hypothetical protein
MQSLEAAVSNVPPGQPQGLADLDTRAGKLMDGHCTHAREILRAARAALAATLQSLRESSGSFRASFRSFSEGGNFAAAEIAEYDLALAALGGRIDSNEGRLLGALEGVEGAQVKLARAAHAKLLALTATAMREAQLLVSKTAAVRRIKLAIHSQHARATQQVCG